MNKISAVIITFNEERNIGRCLNSLQDIADEIIVVDSFSTDNTERICLKYGVNFIRQSWLGYGAQKNWGNGLAQYDYILSLDADEVLSDELIQSLRQLKTQPMAEAYYLNRRTNYCGQWIYHCGWYPDRKIRLWRKGVAQWTTPRVHETIQLTTSVQPQKIAGDLLHYTYHSIEEHVQVANKYTTLVAEEYAARGKKASFIKIYLNPAFCFFRDYFLRRGFLDGYYGFVICKIASYSTFLKYIKLKQFIKEQQERVEHE